MGTVIDTNALETMRERLRPNTRWAAYRNVALDSSALGDIRFLHVGEGCTLKEAPPRYPDTRSTGWQYTFCGWVNTDTGVIEEKEHPSEDPKDTDGAARSREG